MARIRREMLTRAFDAGIDAFLRSLNAELEREDPSQRELLPEAKSNDTQTAIGTFVNLYRARYGPKARPDIGGKSQGAIKRLLKDYSLVQVQTLMKSYLEMDSENFARRGHDLTTLALNVQAVLLHATGTARTNLQKAAAAGGLSELPEGL